MKKHLPLIILGIILLGWAVFINSLSNQFIFAPSRDLQPVDPALREVNMPVQFGHALNGLYLPPKAGKPVILFFHGNRYNVTHFQDFAKIYSKYGYGILLFDYRGYGKTPGSPSEAKMYEDGESALRYLLINKDVSAREIILWGYSLGCAVALQVADNHPDMNFRAIVLQSPFTNTPEMAYYILSRNYRPELFMLKFTSAVLSPALINKRFDNTRKIGQIRPPMLIGFNLEDRTVPWRMSQRLTNFAPASARSFLGQTGGHKDMKWFENEAVKFLKRQDEISAKWEKN